ncbi:MAG: hypothetical protein JSW48_10945 [Betaproteobacteria bacterium]|nr:MAG: hypothetical protein JSW48_10945 [Betaproteobacteria bacterium]
MTLAVAVGFGLSVAFAAESDAQAAARLRGEIAAVIVDASWCRNIVNCRIVGLGARPCGGHEEYVAFSIWNNTGDELRNLVTEYNLLREELILESDGVGICEALPKPNADCVQSRCVTVPTAN